VLFKDLFVLDPRDFLGPLVAEIDDPVFIQNGHAIYLLSTSGAQGNENLLPRFLDSVKAYATIG